MDPLTRAWVKVVIDGQAYLYAQAMRQAMDTPFTDSEFEGFENEWKEESANLIQELLDDESAGSVNSDTDHGV